MRARNWRCAEVGVNCGEPQNGAVGGMSNYRSWKEIVVIETGWGECERQITPVENVAMFHVEHVSGMGHQAALFHVEQRHTLPGALADGEDHLIGIGQTNRLHPLELMGYLLVGGHRSLGGEQQQIPLGHP